MSFFRELERLAQGISQDMQPGNYGNSGGYGGGYAGNAGNAGYPGGNAGYGGNPAYQAGYDPSQANQMPDHLCHPCGTAMSYRGAHAIRTGGMTRGYGIAADLFLGSSTEELLNTATERNVIVHVFACPQCGRIEFVNDPRKGF